jgi:nicotinate dehydrogenase subunit B
VDWAGYKSLFLPDWYHLRGKVGSQIPLVQTVLINRPEGQAMGAGETAITVVAAAVGNAIFDATGVRLREVPFTPERVRAALSRSR